MPVLENLFRTGIFVVIFVVYVINNKKKIIICIENSAISRLAISISFYLL